jgi:hypothetical protein
MQRIVEDTLCGLKTNPMLGLVRFVLALIPSETHAYLAPAGSYLQ